MGQVKRAITDVKELNTQPGLNTPAFLSVFLGKTFVVVTLFRCYVHCYTKRAARIGSKKGKNFPDASPIPYATGNVYRKKRKGGVPFNMLLCVNTHNELF